MNWASIVLLLLIGTAFVLAVRYIRRNGDVCSGCSRHCRLEKEKRECGNSEKKK
ncbi:MAG: hypothetical protein K2O02_02010 [Lachnospiraceae bacterium]|nr:hypothetical protein [Lachnospiraceae bacterium]